MSKCKLIINVGDQLLPINWQEELVRQQISCVQVTTHSDLQDLASNIAQCDILAVLLECDRGVSFPFGAIAQQLKHFDPLILITLLIDCPSGAFNVHDLPYDNFVCKSMTAKDAFELLEDQKKWHCAINSK